MNLDKKMIKNSIPQIRFKGFDVVWVEKRIADIVKISAGGDLDKTKLKESGKYPVVANALTNKGIVGFYDDYKVKAPAVTVTGRGDVGYAVARHENFTPIVRLLTLQSENIDVDYLENQINSMRILNESTGVPQLTAPQLGNYKVYHPEIEEQSAIGSLFRTLDDLLDSYKDSLANYQSLKASMLAKMFPKSGQTIPEIRLDGFEGEWEVKELGDIVKFYSGLTYKPSDVLSCGTLVLRSSNVRDGELIYVDNVFVNPDIVNCQNVKSGDIVVVVRNGSRDLIGKHALIKSEMPNTVIGAFMTGVRCDNPEFINALLDTKMFISEIHRNLGSTINQITTGNFKRMKFYFPLKDEQQAIGAYFSNLDNLISAHQEKISQLETLKKKLLQDMFI